MSRFAAERRHGAFALALALLPGVNILTLHAVMSDAVTMGRADVLPTYAGGILAAAFGVAFFAPLWGRLRLGTEGEFLLWRYRGAWAARLHAVRSALLGLVVLPLAMGMMLVPMRAVLVHLGGCSPAAANGLLAVLLLAGALANSFRQRMRMDRALGGLVLVLMLPLALLIVLRVAGPDAVPLSTTLPSLVGRPGVADLLLPLAVLWWFASIIDLPNMTGQKLLASRDPHAGVRGAVIGHAAMFLITGLFATLPLALGYHAGHGAYFAFLADVLGDGPWRWTLLLFYLASGAFLLLNTQHWAGALLHANLAAHHIPRLRSRRMAVPAMVLVAVIALTMHRVRGHAFDVIWDLLAITAGVGPVFILRWYLPRITAQVQLTAMVAAMVHAGLWHLAMGRPALVAALEGVAAAAGMSMAHLQVLAIGTATVLTAAVPYVLAGDADVAHGRQRLAELHGDRRDLPRRLLFALLLSALFAALTALPMVVAWAVR